LSPPSTPTIAMVVTESVLRVERSSMAFSNSLIMASTEIWLIFFGLLANRLGVLGTDKCEYVPRR
jgi:hypothetical protein